MLHTHDDFLNAIQTQPADRTLRLVYADWLDERTDPRGELIRVEEEMRQLPVFADRFWELKPRRNELRTNAGPEWCGPMRYGTECEPIFGHGIPPGWRERWRLIREFTERWYRIPMSDIGDRQTDVARTESRFGRKFSPAVCEWIAYGLEWHWNQSYFGDLRLMHAREVPGNAALSLWYSDGLGEPFCDYHLAVLFSDMHESDPPVYGFSPVNSEHHDYGFVKEERGPSAESVTTLALDIVLSSAPPREDGFTIGTEHLPDLLRELERAFPFGAAAKMTSWYEVANLSVRIEYSKHGRAEVHLSAYGTRPLSFDHIPGFLWHYARLGRKRSGIFQHFK